MLQMPEFELYILYLLYNKTTTTHAWPNTTLDIGTEVRIAFVKRIWLTPTFSINGLIVKLVSPQYADAIPKWHSFQGETLSRDHFHVKANGLGSVLRIDIT